MRSGRAVSRSRVEQLHAVLDVLEHVREHDDVEAAGRLPLERVRLDELEPRRRRSASRAKASELRLTSIPVTIAPRARDEVVRELALAAADVEHALPGLDALDEELVVADQPVLRVDAAVEVDREEVDPVEQVAVEHQEAPERDLRAAAA